LKLDMESIRTSGKAFPTSLAFMTNKAVPFHQSSMTAAPATELGTEQTTNRLPKLDGIQRRPTTYAGTSTTGLDRIVCVWMIGKDCLRNSAPGRTKRHQSLGTLTDIAFMNDSIVMTRLCRLDKIWEH